MLKMKWLFLFLLGYLTLMPTPAIAVDKQGGFSYTNEQDTSKQEIIERKEQYNSVKEYMENGGPTIILDESGKNTLDLSNLGLKSLAGLQGFPNANQVHILNLSNNNITEIPEGIFTRFNNVHTLYLQNNNISSLQKGSFHGLQKLQKLVIFNNPLLQEWVTDKVGKDVSVFFEPHNKTTGGYSIKDWIEEKGQPEILPWIGPSTTKMSDIPLYGKNLLDLSKKGYTNAEGLELLIKPGQVQILDISKNSISCIPKGLLKRFTSLTTLIASNNSLRSFPWEDIKDLRSLKQVVLSHNQLTEPPKGELPHLINLELDHNLLSSFDFNDQNEGIYWELKKVWLNDNKFNTIPLGCYPSKNRQSILFDMSNNPLKIKREFTTTLSQNYSTAIPYSEDGAEKVICKYYTSLSRERNGAVDYDNSSYLKNEVKISSEQVRKESSESLTQEDKQKTKKKRWWFRSKKC